MPNIDQAAQFLILQGNTAGTNGDIQIVGANTQLLLGNANVSNVFSSWLTLPEGIVQNMGSCNANTTGTTITLGYPYVSNVYSVGADSNTVLSTVAVTSANTTKIVITSNTTANVFVYWQTWGI
jgi:hypothetical protein